MTRIGLISDTHGFLDESVFRYFEECSEIWHAGDFGNAELAAKLSDFRPLRGVYGNIDGQDIRSIYPVKNHFTVEKVNVFMQHIGGYPKRYAPGVKDEIAGSKVKLFISGHSHILKIIFDEQLQCLHINPGAAGKQGWQKVRTIVRLTITGSNIHDCEVIELN